MRVADGVGLTEVAARERGIDVRAATGDLGTHDLIAGKAGPIGLVATVHRGDDGRRRGDEGFQPVGPAPVDQCRGDEAVQFVEPVVPVTGQRPIEFVTEADVVLIGSGVKTRDVVADDRLLSMLPLDPGRQLIGSQCSGALVLARLGLLGDMPVCTDRTSRPFVEAENVRVLDAPFHARGNIATAGGCLASQYLATWVITRTLGEAAAQAVLDYVAPVGENDETVERALGVVHRGSGLTLR
ncbi:hypothetical protein ABT158_49790 [Nonomuraea sp. NPDC001636]|uniref:hypothetical protein n=1 Tax=Nonomuraea sp. NPDC001636 TaxID=3154391 RepID=UPI0033179A85